MKFALHLPRFVCVSGCVCVCGWMSACKRQCVPVWACAEFPCELQLCRNLSALSPRDAILGKKSLEKETERIEIKISALQTPACVGSTGFSYFGIPNAIFASY